MRDDEVRTRTREQGAVNAVPWQDPRPTSADEAGSGCSSMNASWNCVVQSIPVSCNTLKGWHISSGHVREPRLGCRIVSRDASEAYDEVLQL